MHLIRTLEGHTEDVWGMAMNPDGTLLATTSLDGTVRLWDLATGEELLSLPFESIDVDFSPDGRFLATSGLDKTAKIWQLETDTDGTLTATALFTLANHTDVVAAVAFSPDSSLLATGGNDALIKIWDSNSGGGIVHPFWSYAKTFNLPG